MADRADSEDETIQLQRVSLQRAEQEIRRANEILQRQTRELARRWSHARHVESTTDAILVTDEKSRVTDFNEKYIEMWKVSREILEDGHYSGSGK